MYLEIFSKEQSELLPLISQFKREYFLVGGTAIALHIGHRKSIDFDLFKYSNLRKSDIFKKIKPFNFKIINGFEDYQQLHLIVNDVKITFFSFPYKIPLNGMLEKTIKLPDLLTLAAMKAFALGRRAKWKDYVDLYFILKYHYSYDEICQHTLTIFGNEFNPKLFKMQLGYFNMMDYSEEIEYLIPNPPSEEEVKNFLIQESIRF